MCCASSGSTISTLRTRTRPARCWCRCGTRTVSPATSAVRSPATTMLRTNTRRRGRTSAPTASAATVRGANTWRITAPPRRPRDRRATSCCKPRLDGARNSMVCAQCHSFRDIYALGYRAGENYYDYFLPILEATQPVDRDPAYWPDGRTRRFSNDAFGLWQSECYLKGGLACTACPTA